MAAVRLPDPRMHTGPIPAGPPGALPPQASARSHSEFDRIAALYPQSWRFVGETQPLEDGDITDLLAACTGMPVDWTQLKIYQAGTEITVFATTTEPGEFE